MPAKRHSKLVLSMIDRLLIDSGLEVANIDVIAYYAGPGAFTGLRLGVSVAQGLALAHGTLLLPLISLESLAFTASIGYGKGVFLVAEDARKSEVYLAKYQVSSEELSCISEPQVVALEKLTSYQESGAFKVGGDWPLVGEKSDVQSELTAENLASFARFKMASEVSFVEPISDGLVYVRNDVTG